MPNDLPSAADSPILIALQEAPVLLRGQFVNSSNHTFLVELQSQPPILAVYKPTRGERPLWDFPERTLTRREVAAYIVSQQLGWQLVPETVYRRRKLPYGPGALQRFIVHNPQQHYFTFTQAQRQRLQPVAVFDLLLNNADRKGGHLLLDENDHLWAIDHGICFHTEPKLRTVIWDFAGQPIPAELLNDIQSLLNQESALRAALNTLLRPGEIRALIRRAYTLLETQIFPLPTPHQRSYPWPPI
jgi:hypothetical protein